MREYKISKEENNIRLDKYVKKVLKNIDFLKKVL